MQCFDISLNDIAQFFAIRIKFLYLVQKLHTGHPRHALIGNNHTDLVLHRQTSPSLPLFAHKIL